MSRFPRHAERILFRYLRRSKRTGLRRIAPLLDIWFALVDRVR